MQLSLHSSPLETHKTHGARSCSRWAAFWLGAWLAACGGESEPSEPVDPPYRTELGSLVELAALSADADAPNVKYLARVEGWAAPEPLVEDCYFQDMQRYAWHLAFLRSFKGLGSLTFDAYRTLVMRPASRTLWGGSLQYFAELRHPASGARGVLVFLIYADAGSLEVAHVVQARDRLARCMPFSGELLVFVPELPDQEAFVMRERAALEREGVAVLTGKDLNAESASLPGADQI